MNNFNFNSQVTGLMRSIRRGSSVTCVVTSDLNEVRQDVTGCLNPMIPQGPSIRIGGWDDPEDLVSQLRKRNTKPGDILLGLKGGGCIDSHGFQVMNQTFTLDNCQLIQRVFGCHVGVAIGHTSKKYRLPLHDFVDFWAETPGQLGLLINDLFELAFEDEAVFTLYRNLKLGCVNGLEVDVQPLALAAPVF